MDDLQLELRDDQADDDDEPGHAEYPIAAAHDWLPSPRRFAPMEVRYRPEIKRASNFGATV